MSWGYRAMTAVSGWSGLRPGEVMALTVEDLTLARRGMGLYQGHEVLPRHARPAYRTW